MNDVNICGPVRSGHPDGVDKVLGMVGVVTLRDSMRCAREGGIVCLTGIVDNRWTLDDLASGELIPTAVCLTRYGGNAGDFMRTPLHRLADQAASGALRIPVGNVFHLDQIADAHRCMDENKASGKIVVLT